MFFVWRLTATTGNPATAEQAIVPNSLFGPNNSNQYPEVSFDFEFTLAAGHLALMVDGVTIATIYPGVDIPVGQRGHFAIPIPKNVATLGFELFPGSDAQMLLDNIQITAVPEPSTMILLLSGLLPMLVLAWRRRSGRR